MKKIKKSKPGDNDRMPSGLAFAFLKGQVQMTFEALMLEKGEDLEKLHHFRTQLHGAYHGYANSDKKIRDIPEFNFEMEEDLLKEAEYLLKAASRKLRKEIKAV